MKFDENLVCKSVRGKKFSVSSMWGEEKVIFPVTFCQYLCKIWNNIGVILIDNVMLFHHIHWLEINECFTTYTLVFPY